MGEVVFLGQFGLTQGPLGPPVDEFALPRQFLTNRDCKAVMVSAD